MKRQLLALVFCVMATGSVSIADTFGTGANQFTIDFVNISGNAGSANGTYLGGDKPEGFSDPGNYRMGTYEITNAQWTKFNAAYGDVRGTPTYAYDEDSYWTGSSVPTNRVSWYEAAQFVNWLNTSTNHQVAYKFTGEIHTSSYTLEVWGAGDADGTNLYRNKNAKYFLPTEDEWVKAAYWNSSSLQAYATKAGESVYQGNGSNGGWNYNYAIGQPWAVSSGSQELNGTYDMMGNVWEWMESPYYTGDYFSGTYRGVRGGSFSDYSGYHLISSSRVYYDPASGISIIGFRIASIVPEPASAMLMILGIAWIAAKRKR